MKDIREHHLSYRNDTLHINFLSGVSDYGFGFPNHIARLTNQSVFVLRGRMGVVVMDFPGEGAITHIIQ